VIIDYDPHIMHAAPRGPPRLEMLEVLADASVADLAGAFGMTPAAVVDRLVVSSTPRMAAVPPRADGGLGRADSAAHRPTSLSSTLSSSGVAAALADTSANAAGGGPALSTADGVSAAAFASAPASMRRSRPPGSRLGAPGVAPSWRTAATHSWMRMPTVPAGVAAVRSLAAELTRKLEALPPAAGVTVTPPALDEDAAGRHSGGTSSSAAADDSADSGCGLASVASGGRHPDVSAAGDTAVKVGTGLYRCTRTAAPMVLPTSTSRPVASYVEVAVTETAGGSLAVGLATAGTSMAALLGGAPGSLGLHSSGALVRPGSVSWVPYGRAFGTGDVVGVRLSRASTTAGTTPRRNGSGSACASDGEGAESSVTESESDSAAAGDDEVLTTANTAATVSPSCETVVGPPSLQLTFYINGESQGPVPAEVMVTLFEAVPGDVPPPSTGGYTSASPPASSLYPAVCLLRRQAAVRVYCCAADWRHAAALAGGAAPTPVCVPLAGDDGPAKRADAVEGSGGDEGGDVSITDGGGGSSYPCASSAVGDGALGDGAPGDGLGGRRKGSLVVKTRFVPRGAWAPGGGDVRDTPASLGDGGGGDGAEAELACLLPSPMR